MSNDDIETLRTTDQQTPAYDAALDRLEAELNTNAIHRYCISQTKHEAEAETLRETIATLAKHRDEAVAEVDRLEAELKATKEGFNRQHKLLDAERAENERLRRRGEDDQQIIETMCRERNKLQREHERLREKLTETDTELDDMRASRADLIAVQKSKSQVKRENVHAGRDVLNGLDEDRS